VFDHAELIEMTFVFSGLLSLTKCYSEFRSFQAKSPNLCHCLQQMLSEAVLTNSLMRSFKSCLILYFPVDFILYYSFFYFQKRIDFSRPCTDRKAFMVLVSSTLKTEHRKSRQIECGSLSPPGDWHKHKTLCNCNLLL